MSAGAPAADPAMFSDLTTGELNILNFHLTSGWYKQDAVYPALSEQWWETSWLLRDLHAAHMAHLAGPDCPDHGTVFEYQRSEGGQEFWGCPADGCKQGRWVS